MLWWIRIHSILGTICFLTLLELIGENPLYCLVYFTGKVRERVGNGRQYIIEWAEQSLQLQVTRDKKKHSFVSVCVCDLNVYTITHLTITKMRSKYIAIHPRTTRFWKYRIFQIDKLILKLGLISHSYMFFIFFTPELYFLLIYEWLYLPTELWVHLWCTHKASPSGHRRPSPSASRSRFVH